MTSLINFRLPSNKISHGRINMSSISPIIVMEYPSLVNFVIVFLETFELASKRKNIS